MNYVVFNGSPRPAGNISQMLSAIAEELRAAGHTVDEFRADAMNVAACTGCMRCRSTGRCVLAADDSVRLLDAIRRADGIVAGAPCYWGNIPGKMKLILDRMVYGIIDTESSALPRHLLKGKRGVIVTTSTTPWPFNRLFHQSSGAVRALKEIFGSGGVKIVATIQKGGTRKSPSPTPAEIENCRRAARKLMRQ